MFRRSRAKIIIAIMSILVLLLAGTLGIIYISSYLDVYHKNQKMLERYVSEYSANGNPSKSHPPARLEKDNRFHLSTFYSVAFSKKGENISVDNERRTSFSDDYLTEIARKLKNSEKKEGTSGSFVYLIDDTEDYTLVALMDNTLMEDSITTLFRYTLIFGGAAIVILFFFSLYLARRIIRPLEESYEKQKQFISDAGHELKTPISVISANAEMLSRETGPSKWLSNIQFENNRMAALVSQLLELARTEHVSPKMDRVDLSRLVTGGTLTFESLAFERGLILDCSIAENIMVCGNSDQLGQLVSILVDNALLHCIDGGTVTVSLRAERNGTILSVSNEGEEIPEEQRNQIFERFYRIDTARSGEPRRYGLGLAIAKAIVHSHGGKLSVSCKNHLTTFSVLIPKIQ